MSAMSLRNLLRDDVVNAARHLLGCQIVRGGLRAQIVEVEAYRGEDDPACHAFGKTHMKNMGLFGPPGRANIYLNYGVHWMLNISAHEEGRAAGILIRAAQPLDGLEEMRRRRGQVTDRELLRGPGKLARAFDVTGQDNGIDLLDPASALHLVPGATPSVVLAGPRVGIAPGKWHDVPWRFVDAHQAFWASLPRIPQGNN